MSGQYPGGRGAAIRISVLIVEDNPLHVQRYQENLARDPSLVLAGAFATAAAARAAVGGLAPDVALVDLGLPDGNGFDVIRHIRLASPHTNIMVVSVFGGERNLFEAIEAGATGYLLKDSLPDDFSASIHALQAGESPISPALARLLLQRLRPAAAPAPAAPQAQPVPATTRAEPSPLSPRETSILEQIARGRSLPEIGDALHISPRETSILEQIARGRSLPEIGDALHISPLTVKSHVRNIYGKLEARSRQHAVYLAQQRGLLKR